MKKVTAAVHLTQNVWVVSFGDSDGYRFTQKSSFHNSPEDNLRFVTDIQKKFSKLNADCEKIILVSCVPASDRIYPLLIEKFINVIVAHPVRLQLHTKRLRRKFKLITDLAIEATITSIDTDHLLLETTNTCTFNCLYCTENKVTRKKERMPFQTAIDIIDEYAANSTGTMAFHVMGEPTTNPDLPQIIKHVATLQIEHTLTTNASLLSKDLANSLFEKGLGHIEISVQTFTKEQHYAYKRPAPKYTYEKLLNNIKNTIIAKWEHAPNAFMQITILDTSLYKPRGVNVISNAMEAKEVIDFWINFIRKIAVETGRNDILEQIENITTTPNFYEASWPHSGCSITPSILISIKKAGHWIQNFLKENEYIIPAQKGKCKEISSTGSRQLAFLANGDAILCCFDYNGKTKIGNIYQSTVRELDAKAKRIRVNFIKNSIIPFAICKRCLGIRVKNIGQTAHLKPEKKELELKRIAIWGTSLSSIETLHKISNCGYKVSAFLEDHMPTYSFANKQETIKDICVFKFNELPSSIEALIFPPEWEEDQALLKELTKTYPKILLLKVDKIALNPFDHQRLNPEYSKHIIASQQKKIYKLQYELDRYTVNKKLKINFIRSLAKKLNHMRK